MNKVILIIVLILLPVVSATSPDNGPPVNASVNGSIISIEIKTQETCEPCHSLIPGDASELSLIHHMISLMKENLSKEGATYSNRTPICVDCHFQYADNITTKIIDTTTGKVTTNLSFTLPHSAPSCLQSDCHPDKNDTWVNESVDRWKKVMKEVQYTEAKSVFPPQPKPPVPLSLKLAFTLAVVAIVLVISGSLIAYRRKEQ